MKKIYPNCFYSILLVIFVLLVAYKYYISHFKSYTNRSKVNARITQHCAQFNRKDLMNNTLKLMRNTSGERKKLSKMTRIGFFIIGK